MRAQSIIERARIPIATVWWFRLKCPVTLFDARVELTDDPLVFPEALFF
jgi:hypothetical protein